MYHLLRAEGADVTLAINGPSAIDILDQNPEKFSLILIDIQMPLMDGIQVTRHLRHRLTADRLPIIAVTAGILPAQHKEAMASGMNQVVRKPVEPEVLIKTILKVSKPKGPFTLINHTLPNQRSYRSCDGLLHIIPEP